MYSSEKGKNKKKLVSDVGEHSPSDKKIPKLTVE